MRRIGMTLAALSETFGGSSMSIVRRLLLAAALAISVTLLVPAAPASALVGKEMTVCSVSSGGTQLCFTIIMPYWWENWRPIPGCPCVPSLMTREQLDPKIQGEYINWRNAGMQYLSRAAVAEDSGDVERLRASATEAFLRSAEFLGTSEIELINVGLVNMEDGKFYEYSASHPMPGLVAAGRHLVEGLRLMQRALGVSEPQPIIDEAMAHFDESYRKLTSLDTLEEGREETVCSGYLYEESGGWEERCFPIIMPDDSGYPFPVCRACVPSFNIRGEPNPEIRWRHVNWRNEGMRLLSRAAVAKDPGDVESLRASATEAFLRSAEFLGTSEIELISVGWVNMEDGKFYEYSDSDPMPALVPAGRHLVEGLRLMQRALGASEPQPIIDEAMAHFDESYRNLASVYVG